MTSWYRCEARGKWVCSTESSTETTPQISLLHYFLVSSVFGEVRIIETPGNNAKGRS